MAVHEWHIFNSFDVVIKWFLCPIVMATIEILGIMVKVCSCCDRNNKFILPLPPQCERTITFKKKSMLKQNCYQY